MSCICILFISVVTEKTNILLRFLHQTWERKVRAVYEQQNMYMILTTCGEGWMIFHFLIVQVYFVFLLIEFLSVYFFHLYENVTILCLLLFYFN